MRTLCFLAHNRRPLAGIHSVFVKRHNSYAGLEKCHLHRHRGEEQMGELLQLGELSL